MWQRTLSGGGGGSTNLVVTDNAVTVGQSVTKTFHTDNGIFYTSNYPYDNNLGCITIKDGVAYTSSGTYTYIGYNTTTQVLSLSYSSSAWYYRACYNDLG